MLNQHSCFRFGLFAWMVGFSQLAFSQGPTYQLVYRFQPGQFSHYEVEDRAEITTQAAANQYKSIQQTQMLKSYRVVLVDENGGATLEPIVEKVRMSSQSGEKPIISYDSTNGEGPPKEFEKVAGTIGRPLARFHVSKNGQLIKVTLLVTDVPKNFSEAAEKTDPAINFLVVFPENELAIGDKWSEKYDTPIDFGNGASRAVKMIKTYELAKVDGNVASIRFRTNILAPLDDPAVLRHLVQLTPTGTIEFDMKQGRILTKSLVIDEKVVGAFGPQTLLEARGESLEKLVGPKLAAK